METEITKNATFIVNHADLGKAAFIAGREFTFGALQAVGISVVALGITYKVIDYIVSLF